MCVDSYSQMLDLPAFFSSNSEIMGVVCTHGVGRFHEPSRSSNFGAPQPWDPWDTPKSPFSYMFMGKMTGNWGTFCSQASNLKPLGTGQPGACWVRWWHPPANASEVALCLRSITEFWSGSKHVLGYLFVYIIYIYIIPIIIIYSYIHVYMYICLSAYMY